ncbi:MAG: ATP-binding protein [Candidatus Njordarchaeum guaymaensis]
MEKSDTYLGLIVGKTRTNQFNFRVEDVKKIIKNQYVIAINKKDKTKVLAQILDIITTGGVTKAKCEVLGEIHDDKKLYPPQRPLPIGSSVYMPSTELLTEILYKAPLEERLLLGKILTHPEVVPVYFNPRDLSRHMVIVATTGGGKSYTISVIIEELLKISKNGKNPYAILVFDVHNEYGGLALPNSEETQVRGLEEFGLEPKGFEDQLLVFDWNWNPPKLSAEFDIQRLLFLYGIKEQRFAFILKELMGEKEKMDIEELLNIVDASDLHPSTRHALVTRIRALKESGLFDREHYLKPQDYLKPGKVTIFRLAETPMGDYGLRFIVADILRQIYDLVKERKFDFNIIAVVDEAHLFAPRAGKVDAVREVIERISREGRKYGYWLILATQAPRDLSLTVIANCSSILALKMQKRDIGDFSEIFGISQEISQSLIEMPPGKGYLRAPSLTLPLMISVRPRQSSDIKGGSPKFRDLEEKLKDIAEKTKETIKPQAEIITKTQIPEEKEKEVIKIKPPIEETKKKEHEKKEIVEKESKISKETKTRKKKIIAKRKFMESRLEYEKKILDSIIEEIRELGPGATELIKKLIEFEYIPISKALTFLNDRVLDTLLLLDIIKRQGSSIVLNLRKILTDRLGKKPSRKELETMLTYIKDRLR